MFAQLTTSLILGGTFLLLFNVVFSGAFLAQPPRGDRAMIVVLPMLGTVLAGVLFCIAAGIGGVRSPTWALGLVHSSRAVCTTVAILAVIGIVAGCFSTLVAWAGGARARGAFEFVSLMGYWFSGVIAPIVLAAGLMVATRATQESITSSEIWPRAVRVLFVSIAVLAFAGYLRVGANLAGAVAHHRKYAGIGLISQLMPDEYVRQRLAGSATNNIAAELPRLGPDAPLWNLAALLIECPGESPQSTQDRRLVLDRAIACDDLDTQVTLTCVHPQPLLRRGVFLFISSVSNKDFDRRAADWSVSMQLAIDTTADTMRGRPDWAVERTGNPDPVAYLSDLLAAAQRFRGTQHFPALQRSLQQLAAAAARLNPGAETDRIRRTLEAAGFR